MSAVRAHKDDGAAIVSGEFPLTVEDFRRIGAILREDSGIHLPEGKAQLVYSRLAKRLRLLGLESFNDYCRLVSGPEGHEERRAMLTALTTNVTRFFREPHHFDHLKKLLAGGLAAKAKAGGRLRFWSAACSSGEEPYSLAMTILSALPDAADLDVRILASDIDVNILAKARAGAYPANTASQLPVDMRKWLRPGNDGYAVDPILQKLVAFRELNLMAAWPMKGKFDAIFCRNVAIYFDLETQEKLWSRFAERLNPEGRLYIGHSERVGVPGYASDGLTVYRLQGGAA
jgi:chemotaxis protein methyltransferase CheR